MRALYERIATAALDALDHQGYDVASYRDAQGRVIVQLDKIDRVENLIIGDRVNVKQGEAPAPKPSGASPAA
jgi:hypothetical protein